MNSIEILTLIVAMLAVIVAALSPFVTYKLQKKLELYVKELEVKLPTYQEDYKEKMEAIKKHNK